MEYSPVAGSAATNLTSLMRMEESLLSPSVSLICLAKSCALEPPIENARTRRVKSSGDSFLEKRVVDSPPVGSNGGDLGSAMPPPVGLPSRRNVFVEIRGGKT